MQDVPYGHCHCGCGAKTRAAPKTMRSRGWVKGRPVRYIHGHHAQKYQTVDERYVVRESGYTTACWVWTAGKLPVLFAQPMRELVDKYQAFISRLEEKYGSGSEETPAESE